MSGFQMTIYRITNRILSFQFWTFRENTKQLHHGTSGKCLAISESKDKLLMEECNPSLSRQQWTLENYDSSKL